ncbi:MAG TPA: hypothetical protein VME20_00705 [Acidimicrobiales bacterium]|nr:hypothetical protein [Acidimicrobiales bacterium]
MATSHEQHSVPPPRIVRDELPPDDLLLVVRGGANSLSDSASSAPWVTAGSNTGSLACRSLALPATT